MFCASILQINMHRSDGLALPSLLIDPAHSYFCAPCPVSLRNPKFFFGTSSQRQVSISAFTHQVFSTSLKHTPKRKLMFHIGLTRANFRGFFLLCHFSHCSPHLSDGNFAQPVCHFTLPAVGYFCTLCAKCNLTLQTQQISLYFYYYNIKSISAFKQFPFASLKHMVAENIFHYCPKTHPYACLTRLQRICNISGQISQRN